MRLFRQSRKERRSEAGSEKPDVDIRKRTLDPTHDLIFDRTDLKCHLKKANERPPTSAAPAPKSFFRRLSKKKSQKAPAPSAALEPPHRALFRRPKDEDKLTAWGVDPFTGIRHENPPRYLDPTPTESVRFVTSRPATPKVKNLPGGKRPVGSRRYCAARTPDQVSVEPPCPRVEALGPARVTQPVGRVSYLETLPTIQELKKHPRLMPVNPVKSVTESLKTSATTSGGKEKSTWLFLQGLVFITHEIVVTFNRFLPAWKVLQNPKVTRDEFVNASGTVWLAMMYSVALWAGITTVAKIVCFMAEDINWVLGIVSLVMAFSIFSSCCLEKDKFRRPLYISLVPSLQTR